jgi:hypothetical protein
MKPLIIILALGIVGAVLLIAYLFSMERRKKLSAYAASRGWRFSPEKDKGLSSRFPAFKCLRRGHSRYGYNIMEGRRDSRDVFAFDYHYVTGHGKNRRVHQFSALVINSPLPLKPLYLRPENIFDKVSDFFGHDDIDFESAEFSRKFFIKAPEKRWAYDVIHQQMMAFLLEQPRFHIQFDTAHIMAWRNRRFREEDFDHAFELIQGMLSRLPDYVRRQQTDRAFRPEEE